MKPTPTSGGSDLTRRRPTDRARVPYRYDPLPSILAEQWLTTLTHAQLKVYLYILRRTRGFGKPTDILSLDVIAAGNGRDQGTGLSKRRALDAVAALEQFGLLRVTRRGTRRTSEFEILPAPNLVTPTSTD